MTDYLTSVLRPIFNFLINPPGWISFVKGVFLIISLILLGFIVFSLITTTWLKAHFLDTLKEFFAYQPFVKKKWTKKWNKIKNRLETGVESEAKLAIIEADSLLEEVLKEAGYEGKTLEERLKSATKEVIPNLEEVLEARKIRDNIVYDPDYKLDLSVAKKTLSIYEKTIQHLDIGL